MMVVLEVSNPNPSWTVALALPISFSPARAWTDPTSVGHLGHRNSAPVTRIAPNSRGASNSFSLDHPLSLRWLRQAGGGASELACAPGWRHRPSLSFAHPPLLLLFLSLGVGVTGWLRPPLLVFFFFGNQKGLRPFCPFSFDSSRSVIGTVSLVRIPNSKPESLIRPSIDYSIPSTSRFDFHRPRN